ncbi:MAG: response regulator transcription factor, partial [Gemmataceae bacterium]|nr:response regulator transcription factor [Gemmataceae bacterium]
HRAGRSHLLQETGVMHTLVIEDDAIIGKNVQKGLTEAGHNVVWVRDGRHGLEQAVSQKYEVIILDLMLPQLDGLSVLGKLRQQGIKTPVIVLTALGSVNDKVTGFKLGADDYLAKPFEMAELLARLDAVCRRATLKPAASLQTGDLTLDLTTRRVKCGGVDIELTPTEFSILELLMRHAGQVVTRKMLCEHLWTSDWEGTTNVIEVHINRLRTKLLKGTKEPLITTIRGRGYALRAL